MVGFKACQLLLGYFIPNSDLFFLFLFLFFFNYMISSNYFYLLKNCLHALIWFQVFPSMSEVDLFRIVLDRNT